MKRLFSILLCLCLLAALVPAMAAGVSKVMCVTNCEEWVSLRDIPDKNGKRLSKVYLGELVTNCRASDDGFIYCEYNGQAGYIMTQYLKMTDFTMNETFPGNQMVVNVSEWASLWSEPDASSSRVAQVPVGTIVTACVTMPNGFIYCTYTRDGEEFQGFISTSYLKKANYSVTTQDTKAVANAMTDDVDLTMVVVNCNDWVSLREKASASSARLARVPLGAKVEHCVQVSDSFIYGCYQGLYGYIQAQYLAESESNEVPDEAPAADAQPAGEWKSAFAALPELPDYQTLLQTGDTLLAEAYQGYTVVVQRAYSDYDEMLAVCYDQNHVPLWRIYSRSLKEMSNIIQLDAFIAGTIEDPQLIWYEHGVGISSYAYGPAVQRRWFLPDGEIPNIDDSVYLTADYDGTIYVAFSDELMKISTAGELLWRTSCNNPDIFWPISVEIDVDGISVLYDNQSGVDNLYGEARFSPEGELLFVTTRQFRDEA